MTFRLAEKRDSRDLADLLCEHISFIWDKPISESELELMRDFYYHNWNDKDTAIVCYESEGNVIATGTVGIVRCTPLTSSNIFGRIGFITDITVASPQRSACYLIIIYK